MSETTESGRPVFLAVDDDPMVRKLVTRGLEALEPRAILEVQDGLEAQQVLHEHVGNDNVDMGVDFESGP